MDLDDRDTSAVEDLALSHPSVSAHTLQYQKTWASLWLLWERPLQKWALYLSGAPFPISGVGLPHFEVSFISNIYRLWFKCATPWRLWVIFTVWVSAEGRNPSQKKTETLGAVGSSFLDVACDPDAPTASLSVVQTAQWGCVHFGKPRVFSKTFWNTIAPRSWLNYDWWSQVSARQTQHTQIWIYM